MKNEIIEITTQATMKHSISNYAFTERGLYMLATMEQLQNVTDGGEIQQNLLQKK